VNNADHPRSVRLARLFTAGQITFGLRESVIVVLCAVGASVLGALVLS
jgi:hypothetical protein